MRAKNIYQFRGWLGVDCSNDISLFDYGFLINPKPKKNHHNIVYKGYTTDDGSYFYYSSMSQEDWEELIKEGWFELEKVMNMMSMEYTKENIEYFSIFDANNLHSAIMYHGTENILGSQYHDGFKINE